MRLFIAINFSQETRQRLVSLQNELRSRSLQGKFSLPENLHMTLVFLGACDAKQTAAAKKTVAVINVPLFELIISGYGQFSRSKPDICYAFASNNSTLLKLQKEVYDTLTTKGFKLDSRKFRPHITLGRNVLFCPEHNTLTSMSQFTPVSETVRHISLMKSERINGKLTYTEIMRSGEHK